MNIINIDNKDRLNDFVSQELHSRFLQSWEWGEFQKHYRKKVYRLGVMENGRLAAAGTLIKKNLFGRFGYFYCPGGPLFGAGSPSKGISDLLFKEIRDLARSEQAFFLRFEPEPELAAGFLKQPVKKTIAIQPVKTIRLELKRPEEEILNGMRQKTRYNIRLAEKKGVAVRRAETADFERFWKLMLETVRRDGFRLHVKDYYRKMLAVRNIELYIAEYEGKVVAGNILAFFGDTATYLHGASDYARRNVMAPYCLQWQAIKLARQRGLCYYDFYGVDEKRWPGVTRFKRGFGGEEHEYPGTFDLIFNKNLYNLYRVARRLRRTL